MSGMDAISALADIPFSYIAVVGHSSVTPCAAALRDRRVTHRIENRHLQAVVAAL
jgi:hypothetical protein